MYAQNCCRSQSSDEGKIKSLGTKLRFVETDLGFRVVF
jgi:hypothetical protein